MLCGYCHLVFHPTCLDPLTGVENWDELAELNAIEYAVKYATKTKPGDYVIDCAPPVAGGAAVAAVVGSGGGGGRRRRWAAAASSELQDARHPPAVTTVAVGTHRRRSPGARMLVPSTRRHRAWWPRICC